jgi:hypothetical protein
MRQHLPADKLELIHEISDLVERSGLWLEIARLGMTREFIERSENVYARLFMELDCIEKLAPHACPETRKLRSIAATLSLEEQRRAVHASRSATR